MDIKRGFTNLYRFLVALAIVEFIFSACFVSYCIYDGFKMSKNLSTRKEGKHLVAIVAPNRSGEKMQAEMIKNSLENKGHKAYIFIAHDEVVHIFYSSKYMYNFLLKFFNYIYKPDLHLAISFHVNINLPEPKVMYLSLSPEFIKANIKDNIYFKQYSKFIDINMIDNKNDWLTPIVKHKITRKAGIVGVPANNFHQASYNSLILYGSLWGRNSNNIMNALQKLAAQDYMYFIKIKDLEFGKKIIERNKDIEELLAILNKHGIALCIHTPFHNKNSGVPGSRIFEIISSGVIAISDNNPFVKKYFADNVLYFDEKKSSEEIFKAIDSHVKWIKLHPLIATKKAKKAHKILQKNFTTEKFVDVLLSFVEK